MSVTIYTKPDCAQCDQTKKYMDRHNIKYEVVDLTTNPEALEKVQSWGFTSAPVVETDDDRWAGFRMSRLIRLAEKEKAE